MLAEAKFRAKALCRIYEPSIEKRNKLISLIDDVILDYSLEQIETLIVNSVGSCHQHMAKACVSPSQSYRWYLELVNQNNDAKEAHIIAYPPRTVPATSTIERYFGADRILHIKLTNLTQEQFEYCVAKGISFGGMFFRFIGGEIDKSRVKESRDKQKDPSLLSNHLPIYLMTWWGSVTAKSCLSPTSPASWMASESLHPSSLPLTHSMYFHFGQHLAPVTHVREYMDWIGSFTQTKKKFTCLKINARLALGFSATFPLKLPLNSVVKLIDDLYSPETDNIMTDGCGFISVS
jgi:hypothetical protein